MVGDGTRRADPPSLSSSPPLRDLLSGLLSALCFRLREGSKLRSRKRIEEAVLTLDRDEPFLPSWVYAEESRTRPTRATEELKRSTSSFLLELKTRVPPERWRDGWKPSKGGEKGESIDRREWDAVVEEGEGRGERWVHSRCRGLGKREDRRDRRQGPKMKSNNNNKQRFSRERVRKEMKITRMA